MEPISTVAILILTVIGVVLFIKNKSMNDDLNRIQNTSEQKQALEIEIATLKEKISSFEKNEQDNKNVKNELNIAVAKKSELEVNVSRLSTSLDEQRQKYIEFKNNNDIIIDDLKQSNQEQKNTIENYNEEIKKSKSLISELETKVSESTINSEKLINNKNEIIQELKIELEKHKELVSTYNEEIKKSKSLISELETKIIEIPNNYNKQLNSKEEIIYELRNLNDELKHNTKAMQEQITNDKSKVSTLQTQLNEQQKAMEEKLAILKNSEEKLKVEFENVANKIFSENSRKFSEQQQKDLGLLLNPMKQQLGEFKQKVEEVYSNEALQRNDLKNELKTLKDLNIKMSDEANKLSAALTTDNKKQGNWGEMVLDNVLENSGLRLGHEYHKQTHLKDDENKIFKPDVIVHLPDKRDIVIDAKTSLNAYKEYMAESNEDSKTTHLKNHLKSVKDHINGLAGKNYENLKGINTLDFVFMFIPIEGALLLALDNDVNLYDDAFKKKIILVSPTTLLVALRAVENTWRYERQAQNVEEVYKRAERLYAKFNGFVEDMKKIGDSISKADETYKEAFKKLSTGDGNLIMQATNLKQISNIKPKRELDDSLVNKALGSVTSDLIENAKEN